MASGALAVLCATAVRAVPAVQDIYCIQSELGGRKMGSDSSNSNIHQNIVIASTCNAAKPQNLQLHARYRMLKYRGNEHKKAMNIILQCNKTAYIASQ